MSISYSTITGDTFESIARKVYGDNNQSSRIASANPGVSEPLTVGLVLVIPAIPTAPKNVTQRAVSTDPNEVAVLIDGVRFRFWDKLRISRSIDNMASFELGAPFNHNTPGFRDAFRPFTYKQVVITIGCDSLFTGSIVIINPVVGNTQRVVSAAGYSLPGVLNDCPPPASMYPVEFNDQYLKEIATTMCAPFGIGVVFEAGQGAIFERVASDVDTKVLTFLTGLAKERKLIATDDADGNLVFKQSANQSRTYNKANHRCYRLCRHSIRKNSIAILQASNRLLLVYRVDNSPSRIRA